MSCELAIPVHNYIIHPKNNKLALAPLNVLLYYQLQLMRLVAIFSQHTAQRRRFQFSSLLLIYTYDN